MDLFNKLIICRTKTIPNFANQTFLAAFRNGTEREKCEEIIFDKTSKIVLKEYKFDI